MNTYRAIRGNDLYPSWYLADFGICDYGGMNGNFTTKRECSEKEIEKIAEKLTAFHCAPVELYKQWYCEVISCWRLVYQYKKIS